MAIIAATASELSVLHAVLDRFWARAAQSTPQPLNSAWHSELTTVIAEISANIILHAYPQATPSAGCFQLRLRLYADRVEARLIDQGVAYQPAALPSLQLDNLFALREGGFGMMIVRAAVDQLSYHRTPSGTNCWRVSKRF